MSHSPPEPEIEQLLEDLASPEAKRRESTAKRIVTLRLGDERIISALENLAIRDPIPFVREAARLAVVALPKPPAVGDRTGSETEHHIEYLLAWLDTHAEMLGPEMHTRLLDEAQKELESARAAPPLRAEEKLAPVARPAAEIAPPAARGVAREPALAQALLAQIPNWVDANAIGVKSAVSLHEYLSARAQALRTELAGSPVETAAPPEADLLNSALESLPAWTQQGLLFEPESLRTYLNQKRVAAEAVPAAPSGLGAPEEIARELALIEASLNGIDLWRNANAISVVTAEKWHHYLAPRAFSLRSEFRGRAARVGPVAELDILNYLLKSLVKWAEVESVPLRESESLRDMLSKRRDAVSTAAPRAAAPAAARPIELPVPAAPVPALAPRQPVTPPKPAAPPIDWEKVWQRAWGLVVSGALLRGLLYLGAFMIVVSAAVLVIVYWSAIPKLVQLGFAVALPLSFYVAGFILRARLKIPVAGGVFTAIGALLVAVDFAAVYQLGGLAGLVDINAYWLVASFFCTLAYIFTAWRMRTEFYGYITHLAVSSTVLAFTRVLQWPPEWGIAAVTASAVGGVEAAARLGRGPARPTGTPFGRWSELAAAARRLPQILIPATLAFVIFGKDPLAQMAAFGFAAVGFALLVWRFPAQAPWGKWTSILSHTSVWSSVGAAAYALRATSLPIEWYGAVVAVLAPCYVLIARWMRRQTRLDSTSRPSYLAALNFAGIGLVAIAAAAGFVTVVSNLWASVLALTLSTLVLAAYAYLFRRSVFVLCAAGLFVAPFSFAIARLLLDSNVPQWGTWLMIGWAGLALAYLGIALLLRAAPRYGMWLNLVAHLLAPAAFVGLWINYQAAPLGSSAGPALIALAGGILVYVASAVIHDGERDPALSQYLHAWLPRAVERAIFLYPVGILVPVWMSIAWYASVLGPRWLGAALTALALAYVGAGQALAKRKPEYRLPPHVYAYPLALAGVLVALGNLQALTVSLYLVVAVLAALAFVYRRVWETALAAMLFVWPVELSLELSPLAPHAYSLVYALLASLGYIPLGLVLGKAGRKFALPLYIVGYALSVSAVFASLAGRFGVYRINVPWVGVVVPLIVAGLLVFSAFRFKRAGFAWVAVVVLPIALGQTLTLLHILPEYDAAAWVGLAFAYMLIDRFVPQAAPKRFEMHPFQLPLRAGAAALGMLGLLLTASDTAVALISAPDLGYFPLILAQVMVVVLTVLAARLYRNRWVLYIEPAIAFFPVMLFFIGYSAQIFGRPLTAAQFALVWAGLGVVHLVAAALLDERPVRYSHGLYLGGYALSGLALLWSASDRLSNVYTMGAVILAALASHLLVHFGRHHSFDDFIRLTRLGPATVTGRAARSAFLFFVVYALPVWLVQLLIYLNVPLAWLGVALALAAPVYIASGLMLRRLKSEYTWPLYSAGYALCHRRDGDVRQ